MAKRFRKKARQLKVTIDIPDQFEDDEGFMEALQETLDAKTDNGTWCLLIEPEDSEEADEVTIHSICLGDVLIEPEGEEEED